MVKIFGGSKLKRGKKSALSELSLIAREERDKLLTQKIQEIIREEISRSGIHERLDEMGKKITDIDRRYDEMKRSFLPLQRAEDDSVRKLKMKRVIIEELKKRNRLTSPELAAILNLSRTRSSEYLTELERAGLLKGVVISRQKFFELKPGISYE